VNSSYRYDGGLVAVAVPTIAAALKLTGDEQQQMGLHCGPDFATVLAPLRSCSGAISATRIRIPPVGTENDDRNPPRIAVRKMAWPASLGRNFATPFAAVPNAAKAVAFARKRGYLIIHVGLVFNDGHPEIPNTESRFKRVKDNNLFVKGTASAEFHPDVARAGDLIVYKHRVGAFSENELHLILRARGITHLVFFGISTSGITLSTIRRAVDLDFICTVLSDACFDPDPDVHRVLTEKVFAAQATVRTVDAFIAEQTHA